MTHVEIFENTGKDLRFLVWKIDPLTLSLKKLPPTCRRKKRRQTENVLVRCKKPSLAPDRQGDDRGGESPVDGKISAANCGCDTINITHLSTGGLPSIDLCNFDNFEGSRKTFFTFTVFSTRSFDLKERLNMAAVG